MIPELEQPCERCQGTGRVARETGDRPHDRPCPDCDADGVVPTEFGNKVLAFVLRRIKVSAKVS